MSVGDRKRGDQTNATPLPSPLAARRPQPPPNIAPVSAISPPRRCRSPSSATTMRWCDSSGAAARRINVAPPFPRPYSLVLSSCHCRCRRCRCCCRRPSSSLLPSPSLSSSPLSSPRPPRPLLPPPPIMSSTPHRRTLPPPPYSVFIVHRARHRRPPSPSSNKPAAVVERRPPSNTQLPSNAVKHCCHDR